MKKMDFRSLFSILFLILAIVYAIHPEVSFEMKVLVLVMVCLFDVDMTMRKIRIEMQEQERNLASRILLSQRSTRKYLMKFATFLRDADSISALYEDGLLCDPSFVSNGNLTINLPNGMALCVKEAGYPAGESGVYINLRDVAGNEDCVIRAEFRAGENGEADILRVIAYQQWQTGEVLDYNYLI